MPSLEVATPAADRRPAGQARPLRIITADRGWFDWRLGQLWRSRELIGLFVWRDFVSLYVQTLLGPAWHLVRPLTTTVLFVLVFSRVAGLPTDGVPPFLFYLAGNVAWTFFAGAFDGVSRMLIAQAPLLGKVSFHRLVIPVAILCSNLVGLAVQAVMLAVVLAGFAVAGRAPAPTTAIVLLPLLVCLLALCSLGGGLIICALTTKYRDLAFTVTFLTQCLMFVTPVILPASAVPPAYAWMLRLNPLSPIFECLRLGLFGRGVVTAWQLAGSAVAIGVLLTAGITLFMRAERTFVDTL